MQIGKLDQQIKLYSLAESNVGGQLVQTYTLVCTVPAHVLTQRGTEALEAARLNAKETIRVMIRYRDDINNKWRITWRGQNYYIIHTDRSGYRDGVIWLTAELTGAL